MRAKSNESGLSPIWNWKITALSLALLFFVGILAVSFGPVPLSFGKILRTLFGIDGGLTGQERTLLIDLRLPRALLAALVGAVGSVATIFITGTALPENTEPIT